MKVFISHKDVDSAIARAVASRLRDHHRIDSYLDVVDANLTKNGEALGDHLRRELGKCTELIAVISEKTRESWWVPWEIGIATEKNFPLASFLGENISPPDYLKKWPYLKSLADIDKYADASKSRAQMYQLKKKLLAEDTALHESTAVFYRTIRASLGQQ